jgi:phage FluMu protein Com
LRVVRCLQCNKFLGKIKGEAEIKCPRCGKINMIDTERQKERQLTNKTVDRRSFSL